MIKSDLAEALAVIQSNHIDGRKLDYNAIFKSSISGMLSVLDPHSTYFDPIEYASFRTELGILRHRRHHRGSARRFGR